MPPLCHRVQQLDLRTPVEELLQFLESWASQPRYAMAVYVKPAEARRAVQVRGLGWVGWRGEGCWPWRQPAGTRLCGGVT